MTTPTLTLVFTPRELAVLRGRLDYLFGDLEAQWTTATIPADEDTAFRSWHDAGVRKQKRSSSRRTHARRTAKGSHAKPR